MRACLLSILSCCDLFRPNGVALGELKRCWGSEGCNESTGGLDQKSGGDLPEAMASCEMFDCGIPGFGLLLPREQSSLCKGYSC